MRPSRVDREPEFNDDLDRLGAQYPMLPAIIDEFCDLLRAGYDLPERPIDPSLPNTYSVNLDYPPLGEDGLAHFQVNYHQSAENPWPTDPFRVFTLLVLVERKK